MNPLYKTITEYCHDHMYNFNSGVDQYVRLNHEQKQYIKYVREYRKYWRDIGDINVSIYAQIYWQAIRITHEKR